MSSPANLAAVLGTLVIAHHVADHWVQTSHQAAHKGLPGWAGRLACARHVATYTLTALVALLAVALRTGLHLDPALTAAGLLVSAGSHYLADRRAPLRWIATRLGMSGFYNLGAPRPGRDDNPSLGTGAYALDQSWHLGWLLIAALIIG